MKANKLFSGYDSYGRAVDVAQSISGTWFYRSLSRSLYGMAMSAWSKLYKEEINQIDEDGCYPWDFRNYSQTVVHEFASHFSIGD